MRNVERTDRRRARGPFRAYKKDGHRWITVLDSPFYPDAMDASIIKYAPVLDAFHELVAQAPSSADLLRGIQHTHRDVRIQLLRIFRRYVSPGTSVEMLKKVRKTSATIEAFGHEFRQIEAVRSALSRRPRPDEALIALLAEHEDRGSKGYELTSDFFLWFEAELGRRRYQIEGPKRAGRDVDLRSVLPDYDIATPADFIIRDARGNVRAVGFARYDSDRGGAQEDDRVGGYARRLRELMTYTKRRRTDVKVVFLNDGPGLLLGSMWFDYDSLEVAGQGQALVTTLKMAQAGRLSASWIERALA